MRALLSGRWQAWQDLPAECSLATLERQFGGSTVLDTTDELGNDSTSCTRSSLNDEPILVWHREREVLLVECDFLSAPLPAPPFHGKEIRRLDAAWGATILRGGEWVMADRGLALVVTSGSKVVTCRGFAATTFDHYVATLRPCQKVLRLPNAARGTAGEEGPP
jgi:hypothetical protein